MKRLRVVGLNHRTAPLDIREPLAFSHEDARELLTRVKTALGTEGECVLVNTCNRVELYAAVEAQSARSGTAPDLLQLLCEARGIEPAALEPHIYRREGQAVVHQLFRVAGSLDSLVPGEGQILGQVREAYHQARAIGAAGRLLHGLFQRAVAVGKEIRSSTTLSNGRLSIASVAVGYAEQIFDRLDDKAVLCVGAGKMARLVVDRLRQKAEPARITVCARDAGKAAAFAAEFGGAGAGLDRLQDLLVAADIVITGTGSRQPLITHAMLSATMRRRRYRPLFIIDIAVPRDVEHRVSTLTNVYLYDVDDLETAVDATREARRDAMADAEKIVERHVGLYLAWHRGRDVGPLIDRLFQRGHSMAADELERTLRKLPSLDEPGRRAVEELGRRLVNKLLHGPVSMLRETPAEDHHGLGYQHAVFKLFRLDDDVAPETTGSFEDEDPELQ